MRAALIRAVGAAVSGDRVERVARTLGRDPAEAGPGRACSWRSRRDEPLTGWRPGSTEQADRRPESGGSWAEIVPQRRNRVRRTGTTSAPSWNGSRTSKFAGGVPGVHHQPVPAGAEDRGPVQPPAPAGARRSAGSANALWAPGVARTAGPRNPARSIWAPEAAFAKPRRGSAKSCHSGERRVVHGGRTGRSNRAAQPCSCRAISRAAAARSAARSCAAPRGSRPGAAGRAPG